MKIGVLLISNVFEYLLIFVGNTFISNTSLKLVQNQVNAKQHSDTELLLFENYSYLSSTLSFKSNITYSNKIIKRASVSVFMNFFWLIITKMKMKKKNRPHEHDTNWSRSIHGHKYSKYKNFLVMTIHIFIKQHLHNIWKLKSLFEKVKQKYCW